MRTRLQKFSQHTKRSLPSLLVFILSLFTLNTYAQVSTPVGYFGAMKSVGNRIHGEKNGAPMQVKGASFFWSNWSAKYWNAATVDLMVDEWKVEILRAAWGVENNGTPYSTDHTILYNVVDRCIERGVYVIIDWHTHGLEQNVAAAKTFWNKVFDDRPHYANHPAVVFELFNEPNFVSEGGPDWNRAKQVQEEVLAVIRARGANNLAIIGTPNFSQDIDVATSNPINDPNVAYTLHWYAPNHCAPIWNKIPTAMNNNKAVFGTEWGFWDRAEWSQCGGLDAYAAANEWMQRCDQNKISWASWAISDKPDEQSSLFWSGSIAGNWLKAYLADWRENGAEWPCQDFNYTSLKIETPKTKIFPGEVIELKAKAVSSCREDEKNATWSANAPNGVFSSTTTGSYTISASAEGFSSSIVVEVVPVDGTLISDSELEIEGLVHSQMGTPFVAHLGNDGSANITTTAGALSTPTAVSLDYNVIVGENAWDNQAGLILNMKEDETGFDLSGSTGVSFWYKGPAVDLQVTLESMVVAENWDKFHYVVPASNDWQLHVVSWSQFTQYGWGDAASLNTNEIVNFTWMRNGNNNENNQFSVDQVYVLAKDFDTPGICEDEVLKSIQIVTPKESVLIGEEITLTVTGKSSCKSVNVAPESVVWSPAGPTFSSQTAGTYTITATVDGLTATQEIIVNSDPLVHVIPGSVEAEAYRSMEGIQLEECAEGGQNVGYLSPGDWLQYDLNVTKGGEYTVDFRVASLPGGGKFNVKLGTTTLATVDVPSTTDWQIWNTVSTTLNLPAGLQSIVLEVVVGDFNINWMSFDGGCDDTTLSRIEISPENPTVFVGQSLTFQVSGYSSCQQVTLNPTWSSNATSGIFNALAEGTYTVTVSEGGVSKSTTVTVVTEPDEIKVEAESFTSMQGIELEDCAEGTQNIGWTDAGDWLKYEITVPTTGTYNVDFRVASALGNATFVFEQIVDGGTPSCPQWQDNTNYPIGTVVLYNGQTYTSNNDWTGTAGAPDNAIWGWDAGGVCTGGETATELASVTVGNTGDWQIYETIQRSMQLSAGTHTFRVRVIDGAFNMNYMTFALDASKKNAQEISLIQAKQVEMNIYPNPATDYMMVEGLENFDRVLIFNIDGRLQKELPTQANDCLKIDLNELQSGYYLMRAVGAQVPAQTIKFLKQ
jgi:hypothetical protein